MEDSIRMSIENSRKMNSDNTLVTYDLSTGVDFSNPRRTAELLSEVFFELDVSKWFTSKRNGLEFNPKYKAQIVLQSSHDKQAKELLKDFYADLRKDELRKAYANEIEASATYQPGIGTYMIAGILGSLLIQHSMRSSEKKEYVTGLLNEIMKNVEVKTLQ